MNKMKILVIGASGLLAGPVIRKLDEKGFDLRLFSRSVNPSMFINEYDIVRGDLFNSDELDRAMNGCDAVHISISTNDDLRAVREITAAAKKNGIKFISLISGCTVSEENRWFKFIDDKFRSEEIIRQSGIPFFIFKPTWFFESLGMFVRNGKANTLGHLTDRYHWVAADDLGLMVAEAYSTPGAENGTYYVYGPEQYTMKELLTLYCNRSYPEIKKVNEMSLAPLKIIAFITANKKLKFAVSLFSYFEKVREPEIPAGANKMLAMPSTTFERWLTERQ